MRYSLKTITLLFAFLIALLTAALYLPVLQNDYVNWNNDRHVYENDNNQSASPGLFKWAFMAFHTLNVSDCCSYSNLSSMSSAQSLP
jgi:hypothetical protein